MEITGSYWLDNELLLVHLIDDGLTKVQYILGPFIVIR